MNYEQKYKVALERAREIYKDTWNSYILDIFPELAESEDEMIRKALIKGFKKLDSDYEENVGEDCIWSELKVKDILAWLEKQGKRKDINPTLIEKEKMDDAFTKMMLKGKTAIEAINEEKVDNANKIMPKFKVGDFIVNDYCMGKVIEITNDAYLLDTGQGIPFSCEHNAHLWTIQDAKEGDVLATDNKNCPFIYRTKTVFGNPVAYCGVRSDGLFISESPENHQWCLKSEVIPATKEQCDLLFEKMKEAGYEWDDEKKELRKVEQKPKWKQEDDENLRDIISAIHYIPYQTAEAEVERTDWLKSLKQRMEE